MANKSTGSANISFGLVSIPVKLYLTASADSVKLNMINPKTKSRICQKTFDVSTGKEVLRSELVKGFEVSKGQYVTFTDAEMEALRPATGSDAIEIDEFVPMDSVSMLAVEKSYFLGPGKGADRAYRCMLKVMEQRGVGAVGKLKSRGKDHLVVICARNGNLQMLQMYYSTELRSFDNPCAKIDVNDAEMELAGQLVDQMTNENGYDASKYHDEYTQLVRKAVEDKQQGQAITTASAPTTTVFNLLDALKQSLGDKVGNQEVKKPAKKASAKKKTAKKAVARKKTGTKKAS